MNYIVEDNFDFYSELNDPVEKINQADSSMCMISHELLTYNSITLACSHSFNYVPLYNELCLYLNMNKDYINNELNDFSILIGKRNQHVSFKTSALNITAQYATRI